MCLCHLFEFVELVLTKELLRKFPQLQFWFGCMEVLVNFCTTTQSYVCCSRCSMRDIHGSSRIQPVVRLLSFLQLLRVIGMLIRRETTPKKGTNITVGQKQHCDYLSACHMANFVGPTMCHVCLHHRNRSSSSSSVAA